MSTAAEVAGRTATLGVGAAASYINITMPYLGVPLNVVTAALLGVLAGLAWGEGGKTRKQIAWIALGGVFIACAMTSLIIAVAPFIFKGLKMDPAAMAPMALVIAFFSPHWVPAVIARIGPWLDKIPFIGKKGG